MIYQKVWKEIMTQFFNAELTIDFSVFFTLEKLKLKSTYLNKLTLILTLDSYLTIHTKINS